jgi:two-component system sensor histidine kinase KdpD
MSRELAATRSVSAMARVAVRHVAEVFQCKAVVLLPDRQGRLHGLDEPPTPTLFTNPDLSIAQWVVDHGRRAGLGSDTLAASPAAYLPLGEGEGRRLGVLAVLPSNPRRVLLPEQRNLLETFAGQIALALEREHLTEAAETARVQAETESVRNTLIASISHDLRTPLTVIAGAGDTLAEHGAKLDEATRVALGRSIGTKAREMSALISNVLDLVRLQSGAVALRQDWHAVDDVAGSALNRMEGRLAEHPIKLELAPDLPPVHVDGELVVKVFCNLLDNVVKYTPAGTRVHVSAQADDADFVRVTFEDEGPGLPDGDLERLFDKFQRGGGEGTIVGAGLGLAICRAIVRAHGGTIKAGRRPAGGARFEFTLPSSELPA